MMHDPDRTGEIDIQRGCVKSILAVICFFAGIGVMCVGFIPIAYLPVQKQLSVSDIGLAIIFFGFGYVIAMRIILSGFINERKIPQYMLYLIYLFLLGSVFIMMYQGSAAMTQGRLIDSDENKRSIALFCILFAGAPILHLAWSAGKFILVHRPENRSDQSLHQ